MIYLKYCKTVIFFLLYVTGHGIYACGGGGQPWDGNKRSGSSDCDFSNPTNRVDCGWSGIDKQMCEARGCCYDPTIRNVNNCFYKEKGLESCLNVVQHFDRHTGWGGMKWFSMEISRDSRQGVTKFKSKLSSQDDSNHDELLRKKRAISLYCPDFDYGTEIVFNRVINTLIGEVGNGVGSISIVRPNDPANPIQASYLRQIAPGVNRVEAVQALIQPHHSNPNNRREFPNEFFDNMRTLGALDGDERFHLVASEYSGPPELYNMVPGHRSINRNYHVLPEDRMNDWRSVERSIRYYIGQGGSASLVVLMYHDDQFSGRPDHFSFLAIFFDNAGVRRHFIVGVARNQQP